MMGLPINIQKTESMSIGMNVDIAGEKLAKFCCFKYRGSYITIDCKMDVEITARDLTTDTKLDLSV